MVKIKQFLRNAIHSPSLPLYALAILVAMAHIFMSFRFSDDIWFFSILDGKDDFFKAWSEFLRQRYEVWSSRSAIEGALVLLVRAPIVWKIVDSVAVIYIIFELSRLLNSERSLVKNIIIALMIPIFPVWTLYEAGFVATSINYIIPFACLMPTLSILFRRTQKIRIPLLEYIIAVPFLIFSCFSELISAILLVVSIGSIILYVIERKKLPVIESAALIISIVMLVYHMTCPGNGLRYAQEVETWLPEHEGFGFFEKALLGFNAMTHTLFVYSKNVLVVIFCVSLAFAVFLKSKRWYFRAVSLVPAAFSSLFGLLSPILTHIGLFGNLRIAIDSALHASPLSAGAILMILIGATALASILVALWVVIENNRQYFMLLFVLATGAISKIALGLSPTVWVSFGRATTYLYIAITIATGTVVYTITKHFIELKKLDI